MDKLVALNAFVAVAETGGFSKAARRMGVATSSLTRLVDALESQLGTSLLTRSTRAVTLTDAGLAYLEQVAPLLQGIAEADESISDHGEQVVGPLRVSVPVTFGRLFIGRHVADFLGRYPGVTLDMELSDTQVDLAAERVDVVVRIGVPAEASGLIVRALGGHRRYVVAAPPYLAAHGTPAMPEELATRECLRFSYKPGPQRWTFAQKRSRRQVEIGGRLVSNSADVLRDAVIAGHGIALLAEWLVGEDVRDGRLVRLLADWEVNPLGDEVSVYVAYLPNRRNSRRLQAFVHFLQSCAGCLGGS